MMNGKSKKNTLCAVGDEELSSVCGGTLTQFEYGVLVERLERMGKDAGGEKTPAGVFFQAAANKVRDTAVLAA